jgi:hypothetical protein
MAGLAPLFGVPHPIFLAYLNPPLLLASVKNPV